MASFSWFINAAVRAEFSTASITTKIFVLSTSYSGTLCYSDKSRINEIFAYSLQLEWESMSFKGDLHGIYFPEWIIPGGKENDWYRQAVFYTLESMRKRHGWRRTFILITLFLRRCMINLVGNAIKISVYWRTLSRAQDEGLRFLMTKSFAIITLRHCTRRLHWSCDFSERRSSIILRSSNHRGQHPMLCQKAFGLCSNSGSLLSRKASVAYRRRMRLGKAKQCRSAKRNEKNATEVWISDWNNVWWKMWALVPISVNRNSSQMTLENEAKSQEIERVTIRGVSSLDPCIFGVTGAERFHI